MVMTLLVISADHNNTGASKHPRHGLVYVHVQVIWCLFSYFIITTLSNIHHNQHILNLTILTGKVHIFGSQLDFRLSKA